MLYFIYKIYLIIEVVKLNKENEAKKNSKCLYICESIVDGYEYKKMVKYFPKRVYWVFALRGTILNILITALIAIISQSWICVHDCRGCGCRGA